MPILNKLEYLNATKQQIKNALNTNFNSQIEDTDTFRSYVSKIKDIYNNWSKATGTGSSLNLSPTKKGKMKIDINSTELTQDGTPTPDNPQDIHVITGSNNVKIQNKNLFNKNDVKLNYTWNNTAAGGRSIFFIETKPNETYTISASNWNDLYYVIVYLDHIGATTIIYESGWINPSTEPSKTFTTTAGTNILGIHFKYQSTGSRVMTQAMFDNATIQLEKASTATEYVEHQEQNHSIALSSKNLLDFNNITVGRLGTTGTVTVDGDIITFTANNQTVYGIEINLKKLNLKPNTTYTVSNLYENTGSFGDSNGWRYYNGTSYTVLAQNKKYFNFTTGDGTTNKLYFYLGSPLTYTGTLTLYDIQLLEGLILQTDIPDYAPYIANPIEYCKIGDHADQFFKNTTDSEFYDSTLELNEWYLKKNIDKVALNGSENWSERTNSAHVKQFYISSGSQRLIGYKQFCNYFSNYNPSLFNWGGIGDFAIFANTGEFFGGVNNDITLEDFKSKLAVENLIVYYVLANPQYIHISETDYPTLKEQLEDIYNNSKSYNGQTYITQTNDGLPFNISASALMKGDE